MKFFSNMFEAWFKRKFDTKCKLNINLTLMRIEIIKRRRNAMQKFLRGDIAELLRLGHDSEAYRRVGRLYLDQNRTLCYDFVGKYCTLISDQLTVMNDQSECPDECKEAVSSLIYAAARFGDLPELRKLRTLFSERYENSFKYFVNKEFIDMLNPGRPTKEMKVQLMQEIAQEHGVEWDPESLDNRLHKSYSSHRDLSENAGDEKDKESPTADRENGWMINIQETINNDSNARKKDESNDDIVKQTENMRQRILNFWSRTTSLHSTTSRETSTSPDEGSTSSDESTKSRPFLNFWPRYLRNDPNKKVTNSDTVLGSPTNNTQEHDDNKENEDVSVHPNVEKRGDEKVVVAPRVKNKWRRKRGASNQPDVTVKPQTRHVHPKLPDYDDIKARFAAFRAKT
ncbi:putative vacuolar protein sorting-associated protein Ist1 [Helianthus annuus]|nr:putative vacuolar protein sorting-associated protein Ist1 [Helianthus annuus]